MYKKAFILFILISSGIEAQDFGFGFEDDSTAASAVSVKLGGEVSVEVTPFLHEFNEEGNAQEISFWNASIDFAITSPFIDLITVFNFNGDSVNELWSGSSELKEKNYTPLIIDEAFLRAYIGTVNIEAGYRKLSWGKADSGGPLDVTNPTDYSDLFNITDTMGNKIARPMLHITWNAGDFSKLEGVFIPNFTGHRFATEGRWAPSEYSSMMETAAAGIRDRASEKYPSEKNPIAAMFLEQMYPQIAGSFAGYSPKMPDTGTIEHFQAGLRYTTTIGSVDIGGQYFYGTLFRPNFTIAGVDDFLLDLVEKNMPPNFPGSYSGNSTLLDPQIKFNRYHQIGLDYAQVIADFNVRAEAAIHITEDLSGDDGSVRNPFIGWSLGFDRNIFAGLTLNIQCNETIRLFNDKIGNNPVLDAEAGTNTSATRLSMQLSKKFIRDKLESKATFIWDIENSDFFIIPALIWSEENLIYELSAGIFAGKESGELGQYWKNSFVKLGLKFLF